MEWLVARHIADELGRRRRRRAQPPPLSQLTVDFLCDLADVSACQAWAAGVLADADADDVSRANAIKITTRLRTPARTDLRGANLQGEDLSSRDLQGGGPHRRRPDRRHGSSAPTCPAPSCATPR